MNWSIAFVQLGLSQPFVTSKGCQSSVSPIFVRCHSSVDNSIGFGSVVVSKDAPMSNNQVLEQFQSSVANLKAECCTTLRASLRTLNISPAIRSGLNMAIISLEAQRLGMPVSHVLGLPAPKRIVSGISIGVSSRAELRRDLSRYLAWPIIKLKLDHADLDVLAEIRAHYEGRIWVDGNGAWDYRSTSLALPELEAFDVEILEQPLQAGNIEFLGELRHATSIKIFADEDCSSLGDLHKLNGHVDGVNIKLMKCGGLDSALEIVTQARELGMETMMGCKTESYLGIAAAAQLAGTVDYCDLDGAVDIEKDFFIGNEIKDGILSVNKDCMLARFQEGDRNVNWLSV
ncbi:enolase C-terminal domain-like protein (plasmid) [Vibrio tubiashii]|uniref:Mandelate racemase n=1 Tax=Vibrio tubiashii ATCC 19109 TaxID=1051646 RepID=F9T3W9_9VIBR|nr:enolase C-terminal domain-like protein [Vibrio tubiashii]AIW17163.1 mandelate racemase [Vibrio tubiashii ATCC 19109]EGU56484.1 mandelate racemase/muconate lactonizing protein [Vibrio tubiashii ATCC 19109]EIF03220.1 mandelate racemase [Vibrio tubiashii NCIMB 1337 = ATCC 19106]WCP70339.1 enolase C-terminal domain-like protein [Vibrio tubiashii]